MGRRTRATAGRRRSTRRSHCARARCYSRTCKACSPRASRRTATPSRRASASWATTTAGCRSTQPTTACRSIAGASSWSALPTWRHGRPSWCRPRCRRGRRCAACCASSAHPMGATATRCTDARASTRGTPPRRSTRRPRRSSAAGAAWAAAQAQCGSTRAPCATSRCARRPRCRRSRPTGASTRCGHAPSSRSATPCRRCSRAHWAKPLRARSTLLASSTSALTNCPPPAAATNPIRVRNGRR